MLCIVVFGCITLCIYEKSLNRTLYKVHQKEEVDIKVEFTELTRRIEKPITRNLLSNVENEFKECLVRN